MTKELQNEYRYADLRDLFVCNGGRDAFFTRGAVHFVAKKAQERVLEFVLGLRALHRARRDDCARDFLCNG